MTLCLVFNLLPLLSPSINFDWVLGHYLETLIFIMNMPSKARERLLAQCGYHFNDWSDYADKGFINNVDSLR